MKRGPYVMRRRRRVAPEVVVTMSEGEQAAWVAGLASTDERRVLVIRDLLRHADEDAMTEEDRVICRRQLALLEDVADRRLRWPVRRVVSSGG